MKITLTPWTAAIAGAVIEAQLRQALALLP
jgi:hypothetical protein